MQVPWSLLGGIVIMETCAAASIRRAVDDKNWLVPGMALYGIVGLFLYLIEKTGMSLAITNALWNASSTITFAMLSVFFFHAHLSFRQGLGVFLAFIGCLLAS